MENRQKNSRKRLNSLILLVAFTAVMLIVSTYAWFSAQKNVTISNLEGKVNVAEGLMVSLDAKSWSQEVDFEDYDQNVAGDTSVANYQGSSLAKMKNGAPTAEGGDNSGLYIINNVPKELVPVSTTGTEYAAVTVANGGSGSEEIRFYNGVNVEGIEFHSMDETEFTQGDATAVNFPGYYAIDVFLQNSSKIDTEGTKDNNGDGNIDAADKETQGTATEVLQLNTNSLLQLVQGGSLLTGLQNTARVALAMYEPVAGASKTATDITTTASSVYVTANQSQILTAYKDAKISKVAIWEPNAEQHVQTIMDTNNRIMLTPYSASGPVGVIDNLYIANGADATTKIAEFAANEFLPTFALTSASLSVAEELTDDTKTGIPNIYDWTTTADELKEATNYGLERQIALQTKKSGSDYSIINGGVRDLITVTSPGDVIYEYGDETNAVKFTMLKNSIVKCRLYLWLEGQDPDCINFASHGSGIHLDLGLVKGQETRSGAMGS